MIRANLLLLVCTVFSISLGAQPAIEDSKVTIVSTFEARLTDAERVRVKPIAPAPDTAIVRQQYLITDRPLTLDYPAPVIRPRGIGKKKMPPAKNGYAAIGLGLPNALFGDLSYDMTGYDNIDLGVYARHYSLNNDGNVENQKRSDTEVGARGAYLFDQGFAIGGGLGYETKSRYYYGYNFDPMADGQDPVSLPDDDVRQRFNIFKIDAEIFNGTRTVADIDYNAGIDMYFMDGNPAVRENNIDIHVGATKWINEDSPLDVKFRADFTSYRDTSTRNLNNFFLMPSYTTALGERFRLKLGFNLTHQEDDFDVFPNISIHAPIIDGALSGYLGWDGTLQNNSLRNLVDYNPWVNTRLTVRTAEYWRVYGGVEGTYQAVHYQFETEYKNIDNLATYALNRSRSSDMRNFDVLYDDATVVTLQATAAMEPLEKLRVNGTIAQRFYSMENLEEPFHLPSFTLNLGAAYTFFNDRIKTGGDLYVENGLPYITADGGTDNLNMLFDISLNGEFEINDTFSLWARVNNLLSNKRERFTQYPTIGTNFLIGGAAKF